MFLEKIKMKSIVRVHKNFDFLNLKKLSTMYKMLFKNKSLLKILLENKKLWKKLKYFGRK